MTDVLGLWLDQIFGAAAMWLLFVDHAMGPHGWTAAVGLAELAMAASVTTTSGRKQ